MKSGTAIQGTNAKELLMKWRLRRLEESFAPQENEEVRHLVTLSGNHAVAVWKRVGNLLNLGHANVLPMIKPGICRLPTF